MVETSKSGKEPILDLLNRDSHVNQFALHCLQQRPIKESMNDHPNMEEVKASISKAEHWEVCWKEPLY